MRRPTVRPRLLLDVLLVILLVAAGSFAWFVGHRTEPMATKPRVSADSYSAGTIPGTPKAAVDAAVATVPVALSYDYRHLDRTVVGATSRMTPGFADEFRQTFEATVQGMAKQKKAVTQTSVRGAGVVRSSDDRVTCLVYVDQVLVSSTTLEDSKRPVKVSQNRVLVELRRAGSSWKVDGIDPF